jgi:hypothetical protein
VLYAKFFAQFCQIGPREGPESFPSPTVADTPLGRRCGAARAPSAAARAMRRANTNCIFLRRKTLFCFRAEKFPRRRDASNALVARLATPSPAAIPGKYFCKTVDIQKSRD